MRIATFVSSSTVRILAIGFLLILGQFAALPAQDEGKQTDRQQKSERLAELASQATQAFSQGKYEAAFQHASQLCELEPDNLRAQMLLGEISFAAGKMSESISAYDEAIRIRPIIEPQLWQRGLAFYYADRFEDGVKQFETHQTVNSHDVENAVWHLLCAARIADVDQARKKLIPITGDTRIPMSQIYEMFAGRLTPEEVLKTAASVINYPKLMF